MKKLVIGIKQGKSRGGTEEIRVWSLLRDMVEGKRWSRIDLGLAIGRRVGVMAR